MTNSLYTRTAIYALSLATLISLGACSGTSGQRAADGAGTGALAGAAGGLVSGLLWGGDPLQSAARGAVVGGTAGAVAGGVSGAQQDKRKSRPKIYELKLCTGRALGRIDQQSRPWRQRWRPDSRR